MCSGENLLQLCNATCQYGLKSLRSVSNIGLNVCHKELKHFIKRKQVLASCKLCSGLHISFKKQKNLLFYPRRRHRSLWGFLWKIIQCKYLPYQICRANCCCERVSSFDLWIIFASCWHHSWERWEMITIEFRYHQNAQYSPCYITPN